MRRCGAACYGKTRPSRKRCRDTSWYLNACQINVRSRTEGLLEPRSARTGGIKWLPNRIAGIQNFAQIRERTKSEYGVLVEPEKTGSLGPDSRLNLAFQSDCSGEVHLLYVCCTFLVCVFAASVVVRADCAAPAVNYLLIYIVLPESGRYWNSACNAQARGLSN
jgi:hypothetical protein